MEKVREIVSATLSLRKAEQIRVRQPLGRLTVLVDDPTGAAGYEALLKSELNVKDIEFSTIEDAPKHGLKVINDLKVNARAAGPRLGKQVQFAIKASKSGAWHVDSATGAPVVQTPSGDLALVEGEYELINQVEESDAAAGVAAGAVSSVLPTGGFVILDTALNADLLAEGYARDAIRAVQDARKDAGLDIADRIALRLTVPAADAPKVEQFRELIAAETLATSLDVVADDGVGELGVSVAKA
jgi:isoleucyl-tRNA synthetase